mgnify:CR=1 FL=1
MWTDSLVFFHIHSYAFEFLLILSDFFFIFLGFSRIFPSDFFVFFRILLDFLLFSRIPLDSFGFFLSLFNFFGFFHIHSDSLGSFQNLVRISRILTDSIGVSLILSDSLGTLEFTRIFPILSDFFVLFSDSFGFSSVLSNSIGISLSFIILPDSLGFFQYISDTPVFFRIVQDSLELSSDSFVFFRILPDSLRLFSGYLGVSRTFSNSNRFSMFFWEFGQILPHSFVFFSYSSGFSLNIFGISRINLDSVRFSKSL